MLGETTRCANSTPPLTKPTFAEVRMGKSKYLRPRVEGDKPCSIEGCSYPYYAKGLCQPHYNRKRKHGDPLGGGTPWGAVKKWIFDVAIPYQGDDCLQFPFSRNEDGYGKVGFDGRNVSAHVFVIESTKGTKPTPAHECRHICGNGHFGCVTPSHLEWGTHAENMADAVAHGTVRNNPRYGKDHHDFRATDEVVEKILSDLGLGMTQYEVAAKYGFGQSHISRIKNGWRRNKDGDKLLLAG